MKTNSFFLTFVFPDFFKISSSIQQSAGEQQNQSAGEQQNQADEDSLKDVAEAILGLSQAEESVPETLQQIPILSTQTPPLVSANTLATTQNSNSLHSPTPLSITSTQNSTSVSISLESSKEEIVSYFSTKENRIPNLDLIQLFKKLMIDDVRQIIKKRDIENPQEKMNKPQLKTYLIQKLTPAQQNPQLFSEITGEVTPSSSKDKIIKFLSDKNKIVPKNVEKLLEPLKKTDLEEICKKRGILFAKLKKEGLKKRMIEMLDPTKQSKEKIETFHNLEESQTCVLSNTDGRQHDAYKDDFNGIDLINRKYYDCRGHVKIFDWRLKMITCIMHLGMINCHALYVEMGGLCAYKSFRRQLMMKILKTEGKDDFYDHFVESRKKRKKRLQEANPL